MRLLFWPASDGENPLTRVAFARTYRFLILSAKGNPLFPFYVVHFYRIPLTLEHRNFRTATCLAKEATSNYRVEFAIATIFGRVSLLTLLFEIAR